MRAITTSLSLFFAVCASSTFAAQPYDGVWGDVNHSCQAEDYRMFAKGNRFEWYETRCRARRLSGTGTTRRFEMSCRGEGKTWRSVTRVSLPSPGRLVMENAPVGPTKKQVYKRCPISGT